jgi:hypothetical protein
MHNLFSVYFLNPLYMFRACYCPASGGITVYIQGDQKVSVHLMITIHLAQPDCLAADRQGQRDTRLTLTPSVIPNSNYIIMVSD